MDDKFLAGLYAIVFPVEMKADVNALIAAETKVAAAEHALAQSSNPSYDQADYTAVHSNDEVAAAGIVRHDLGLPPVPLTP